MNPDIGRVPDDKIHLPDIFHAEILCNAIQIGTTICTDDRVQFYPVYKSFQIGFESDVIVVIGYILAAISGDGFA